MSVIAMLSGRRQDDYAASEMALLLARKLNTAVEGLCALPDPELALLATDPPFSTRSSTQPVARVQEMQAELLASARTAFCDVTECGAHGLPHPFRHEKATPEKAAVDAAALADAIIFPRSAVLKSEPLGLAFEHTLVRERLPVVLAGSQRVSEGPLIIAWDGSSSASRALRLHRHLLSGFRDILIAQNETDAKRGGDRQARSPDRLIQWLRERGLDGRCVSLSSDIGGALLSLAKSEGASMILAGAFGHSRLNEFIFGGTTRQLLSAADAPALALSH